jgi:peptidoglycan hydrolase-like protein with peptidoglycan-binding domain
VGEDVIVLKKNLSALGYHSFEEDDGTMIDTGFVVDNVFDDATTEAVKRWQKDQGAEESGVVSPSDVIVLNGPAEVADVLTDVGQRVNLGTRIMDLNMLGIVDTVHYEHSGQVETLVTSGQEITSGDLLYAIDNRAVTAMISAATFDRDIEEGVKSGDDVRAVEDMLFSLGYDVKGDLEVDDVFDDVTKQAITEWQEDLQRTFDGVVVNGIISLGDLIVFEPGTVAGSITDYGDGTIASGSVLWSSSTETAARVIETSISVADQDKLAKGNVVDIEFPDGKITQGTVTSVATSTTVDPMNPEAEPTIAIELSIAQVPTSVHDFNQVNVQVKLVENIATGATVVPVSALVATGDGNFAVEAITTTGTTFLQVRPGMFSDGWVEVTGIQPGTQVVVPS